MKVEQDTGVRRPTAAGRATQMSTSCAHDRTVSPVADDVLRQLPGKEARYLARAPGRLDVMGGLAEYTGSLVLNMPIEDHVCVAVETRTDGNISVALLDPDKRDGAAPLLVGLRELYGADGNPVDAVRGRRLVGEGHDLVTCSVLGVLVEAVRAGLVPDWGGGLSVAIGSMLRERSEAGADAAVAAAMLIAAAQAANVSLDPLQAVTICHRVEVDWLCGPFGIADAVCTLLGEADSVTQVRCDPCTVAAAIRLPDDLAVTGIDCGVPHPEARLKCERVRTATFMGRYVIDRIIQHEGRNRSQWDGYLARVSMTDYVERFRDRIPTKMTGRDFLKHFGETGDPLTTIDPDFVYKIRSRTEHHIYENARAGQFAECLSRAIRKSDYDVLAEAGELMYASHWSYGQRCGLTSVKTDLLVNLIRRQGPDVDIYGAKISGRGCGGVVTVLMRASDRANAALDSTIKAYRSKTGHSPPIIRGSSPGGLVYGAQKI